MGSGERYTGEGSAYQHYVQPGRDTTIGQPGKETEKFMGVPVSMTSLFRHLSGITIDLSQNLPSDLTPELFASGFRWIQRPDVKNLQKKNVIPVSVLLTIPKQPLPNPGEIGNVSVSLQELCDPVANALTAGIDFAPEDLQEIMAQSERGLRSLVLAADEQSMVPKYSLHIRKPKGALRPYSVTSIYPQH